MSAADQSPTLPQYRSISPLAVMALLLGLAAPLALVNAPLLVIPLVALALAAIALRQIASSPDVLSGQRLAYAALFLSVFFLAYTPVRLWSRYEVLKERATQLSEVFMKLLQEGKVHEAHQLSQLKYASLNPQESLSEIYSADKLTAKDLERFTDVNVIRNTLELDRKFTYELDGYEPTSATDDAELIGMRYRIVPDPGLKKEPYFMYLTVAREIDKDSGAVKWRLAEVSDYKPQY